MLASDNAKYRGPARGAQGNALKTLLGIPFALDVTAPVVIDSEGVRHEPAVHLGAGGDVVVEHETSASDRTVGASVTVPLPETLELDPYRLGEAPTNRGGRPRNTSCTRTSAP